MNSRLRMKMVALAALLVVATASPATASATGSAEVTRGHFVTLQGGIDLGMTIEGRGTMVRVLDLTFVLVRVRGLDENTTYPTHVHNAPCGEPTFGGSHYQHTVGGNVNPTNEIWPFVSTNSKGKGKGIAWHSHRARAEAESIVIHHPDTGSRLACVDLT